MGDETKHPISALSRVCSKLPDFVLTYSILMMPSLSFCRLMSSGFDNTIRLWDLRNTKKATHILEGHHKKGRSLTDPIYHNGMVLTIGNGSPYLSAYNPATGELHKETYIGFTPSNILSYGNGRKLAASDGTSSVWAFDDGSKFTSSD